MFYGFQADISLGKWGRQGEECGWYKINSLWLVEISRLGRNTLNFLWQKDMCKNTSDFLIQFCKYKQ